MICLTEPIKHVFRTCSEILEPFIEKFLDHVVNTCTSPAVRFECSDKIFEGPPLEALYLKLAASGSQFQGWE